MHSFKCIAIAFALVTIFSSVCAVDNQVLARFREHKAASSNKNTAPVCQSAAPGRPYLDCLYNAGMTEVSADPYYKDMIGLFAMKAQDENRPFYLVHCLPTAYLKSACKNGLMPSQYIGGRSPTNFDDITKGLGKYVFTRLVVGQRGAHAKFQSLMSYSLEDKKSCFYIDAVQLFYRPFYAYIGDSGKVAKSDSLDQSPYRVLSGEVSLTKYVETNIDVVDQIMSATRSNNEIVILGPVSPMFLLGLDTTASRNEIPQECKTLLKDKYIGYNKSKGTRMANVPLINSGLDQLADYVRNKLRNADRRLSLPSVREVQQSTEQDN